MAKDRPDDNTSDGKHGASRTYKGAASNRQHGADLPRRKGQNFPVESPGRSGKSNPRGNVER